MLYFNDQAELYSESIWIISLSNKQQAYGATRKDWCDLRDYIVDNNLYIIKMELRFRCHTELIGENADGYYFATGMQGSIGMLDGHLNKTFIVGTLKDGIISVQDWSIPEIMPMFEPMQRSLEENIHNLIINGSKLKTKDCVSLEILRAINRSG